MYVKVCSKYVTFATDSLFLFRLKQTAKIFCLPSLWFKGSPELKKNQNQIEYFQYTGARERFLLRGGPNNKKNQILTIFRKFTT